MKATKGSPDYYETIEGRYAKKRKDRLVSLDEHVARIAMVKYGTVENYLVQRHGYNPEEESYSIHRNQPRDRIEYFISKYEYVKIEDKEWIPNPHWQDFIEDEYNNKIPIIYKRQKQSEPPEPPTELCFFKLSDL